MRLSFLLSGVSLFAACDNAANNKPITLGEKFAQDVKYITGCKEPCSYQLAGAELAFLYKQQVHDAISECRKNAKDGGWSCLTREWPSFTDKCRDIANYSGIGDALIEGCYANYYLSLSGGDILSAQWQNSYQEQQLSYDREKAREQYLWYLSKWNISTGKEK